MCRNFMCRNFSQRVLRRSHWSKAIVAAFVLLSAGDVCHATDARIHIALNTKSAAGTGNLFFARRRYRLAVSGVDLAKASIATVDLDGTASNLHNAGEIVGSYDAAPSGTAIASGSKAARLQNAHGVVLELHASKAATPDLNLAGMTIQSRGWRAVVRASKAR